METENLKCQNWNKWSNFLPQNSTLIFLINPVNKQMFKSFKLQKFHQFVVQKTKRNFNLTFEWVLLIHQSRPAPTASARQTRRAGQNHDKHWHWQAVAEPQVTLPHFGHLSRQLATRCPTSNTSLIEMKQVLSIDIDLIFFLFRKLLYAEMINTNTQMQKIAYRKIQKVLNWENIRI